MPETDFKYDVFISYSHKDEEWVVNTLLPALEKADLNVCVDFRDFDAGKPSIVNMEDAVDESRHTVLVLTPNWTGSEWTDFEAVLTQTDDPVGRRQKMIPIMLEKCEPPKRVRSLTYVDFMRSDRLDNAWRQLFKALGKPNAPIPTVNTPKPDTGSRDTWHLAHPYPMPPNFTGRAAEQKMLDDWLANDTDRLFILRALGGFGKSALAWQWINTHVNPAEWTKLVWWSFYEGDASFEHFIEETLKYLKLEVPQGGRPQVDKLLDAMQSQKVLLIMDGFERALRAYSSMNAAYQGDEEPKLEDSQYDCVNINAHIFLQKVCALPNMTSKVLMTTRLTPRAVKTHDELLQGCFEKELKEMDKADAVAFFHAQGIKGTHAEIEAACAPYGYHPLSLRLLAGRILKDFENPADIIVAQRLKIDGDIVQQKHHVLKVSYDSLPKHEQKLLSTIACFRSAVELKTLQSIAENKETLNPDLHDLVDRGLLQHTTHLVSNHPVSTFDLHPIVRRYAYDHFTAPQRTNAHVVLVVYFEAVLQPQKTEKLEDLAPVIELYHHMVRAGELDKAYELYEDRLADILLFQFGAYQTIIELLRTMFPDGEDKPPRLKDEQAQSFILAWLANAYGLSGLPRRAVPLLEQHNTFQEKNNNKKNLAIGLGSLGYIPQLMIGTLRIAESNLRHSIELCIEIEDKFWEAVHRCYLSSMLIYRGAWDAAEQELEKAQKGLDEHGHSSFVSLVRSYRSLQVQLIARDITQSPTRNQESAIQFSQRAIELAEEIARKAYPFERDFIRGHWLLGAAYRLDNQLDLAEPHLSEALMRCRTINIVETEADILLDIARLRYDQKKYEEAKALADEALLITERCGYVLQGADVNLFLAQYALKQEKDKVKAKEYAETALKLAKCDGPPYYYKVAYEEAERFLENLNK